MPKPLLPAVLTPTSAAPADRRTYRQHQLDEIENFRRLPASIRDSVRIAAQVFPFKVSRYLVNELIDWNRIPDDPLFRLAFPLKEMLTPADQATMTQLFFSRAAVSEVAAATQAIRRRLNPNPADQKANVPLHDGEALAGVQHKYRKTVLLFPAAGQTCHSHCSFCFRWSQFTGMKEETFVCEDMGRFYEYVARNTEVTDVLLTGGDPMVISTERLRALLQPFLSDPRLGHIRNIRFGTKSLSFWPYRFVSDDDAGDLLGLFERLRNAGKHVAVMAHFNHPVELETGVVRAAIGKILATGAVIRSQGPLLAHINDDAFVWRELWERQMALGVIPYYMFLGRDTGTRDYFSLPIARALEIYQDAISGLSGLARTARGPVMSTSPGKIEVLGVLEAAGERCFSLRFLQARKKMWENRPFLARYSPTARWLDELEPAFGESRFFFAD